MGWLIVAGACLWAGWWLFSTFAGGTDEGREAVKHNPVAAVVAVVLFGLLALAFFWVLGLIVGD